METFMDGLLFLFSFFVWGSNIILTGYLIMFLIEIKTHNQKEDEVKGE